MKAMPATSMKKIATRMAMPEARAQVHDIAIFTAVFVARRRPSAVGACCLQGGGEARPATRRAHETAVYAAASKGVAGAAALQQRTFPHARYEAFRTRCVVLDASSSR